MVSSSHYAIKALAIFGLAAASPGDNLHEFKDCLYQCHQISCYQNAYYIVQEQYRDPLQERNYNFRRYEPSWKFDTDLSPHLKMLLWDCESNCDYTCQRIITKERKEAGQDVYQFHGKWPFLRVLGVQEFFSAIFSVANFVPHYIGYCRIKQLMKANPPEKAILNPMFCNSMFLAIVTMCAWISSTIFHIRDFLFTEKLDYYFAGLTVLTGFYAMGYRCLKLYQPSRRICAWLWTFLCVAAYAAHIYRLLTDWLYTYNMRANILVGVSQIIMMGLVCFSLYTKFYQREVAEEKVLNLTHLKYIQPGRVIFSSFFAKSAKLYSLYPLLLYGIVMLGMSFEIFDFPPIFCDLIDAHSLWHLVTAVPIFLGWYDRILWDINENVWEDLSAIQAKKDQ